MPLPTQTFIELFYTGIEGKVWARWILCLTLQPKGNKKFTHNYKYRKEIRNENNDVFKTRREQSSTRC